MTRSRTDSSEPSIGLLDGLGPLFDLAPDAVVVVGDDGTILLSNGKAAEMFGYSDKGLAGKDVTALIAGDSRDIHGGHIDEFFRSDTATSRFPDLAIDALRADETVFPARISLRTASVPDVGDVVLYFVRDMTEQQKALAEMEDFHSALEDLIKERTEMLEEATNRLQRQTEALDHILDSMGEGVIVVDQDGRFEFFNAAAEAILGVGITDERYEDWPLVYGVYSADEWTLLTPEQLPLVRALRGESVDNAMIFVRNSGLPEGRHVSVTARPLPPENGKPSGAVAVLRDITSQKRSEEGLRKSSEELERRVVERTLNLARANRELSQKVEERRKTEDALRVSERQFRLMADSLPLLVAYVDSKHRYLFLNARYEEWFGFDASEMAGKPVWEVVGVERYKVIRPHIESVLSGERVLASTEVRHAALGMRRLKMNLIPDIDERGNVQGFYAVGIDVTENDS